MEIIFGLIMGYILLFTPIGLFIFTSLGVALHAGFQAVGGMITMLSNLGSVALQVLKKVVRFLAIILILGVFSSLTQLFFTLIS